jgi:PAS domain S-box-containing protein
VRYNEDGVCAQRADRRRRYRRATGQRTIIGIGREVIGRHKDGTEFPIELSVSEVEMGERRLFIEMVRDISFRK